MSSLTVVNRDQPTAHLLRRLLEQAAAEPLPEWDAVVAPALVLRQVDAGEAVFLQDVHHPYVYAVCSGLLKLCYHSEAGDEWIKSFAYEGRFFASIAALEPLGRSSFMVCALEPSTLERVDYRVLHALAKRHLPWARALHALTMVFAARKEQRERELLTLAPLPRYTAFRAAYPELERRVPQKDLARHLGLTPVGLNRIVARVRKAQANSGA